MSTSGSSGGASASGGASESGAANRDRGTIGYTCAGCGWRLPDGEPPFGCRGARRFVDGADHVLVRDPLPANHGWQVEDDANPFLRYRRMLTPWRAAIDGGLGDAGYVEIVRRLNGRVAAVDRSDGFVVTPLVEEPALASALGVECLRVKDETVNVSGSHKARHLMGTAIDLAVRAALSKAPAPSLQAPLAIASCGNAALAAAVVARAADRRLLVFIPPSADSVVVERLRALKAELTVCERVPPRDGGTIELGDPCVHAFRRAVAAGAVPFSCQGGDNALAIDGGRTLGYELVEQLGRAGIGDLFVQVGGGALASALAQGLDDALRLGALDAAPRLWAVQTEGAHPLERAFLRLLAWQTEQHATVDEALAHAARARAELMWPWESEPVSIAHGILDDETYDWLAIVSAMMRGGGGTVVVNEEALREANRAARSHTAIDVDHTGSSGLAGLIRQRSRAAEGRASEGEPESSGEGGALVLFTGRRRHG